MYNVVIFRYAIGDVAQLNGFYKFTIVKFNATTANYYRHMICKPDVLLI